MKHQIVVDSCCDNPLELQATLRATTVPLTLRLGTREFVDDDSLNLPQFMAEMRGCSDAVGSASPSPAAYQAAFEQSEGSFSVVLSDKLSGSYSSAVLGKALAEENGFRDIHIFDSKSASAGMTLVALKLRELIDRELERQSIVDRVEEFIDSMKTFFVLERYDNLQKNGRLGKVAGKLISVMNIRLIMGADGNGSIALYAKPRGREQMLDRLVALIRDSGRQTEQETLVISHCNNPGLAERLSQKLREAFNFGRILVVPTGGLSSLYADEGGIVMAF
ncbi:DegV family protein [Ruminococcaceae bacterium OttesenSCG-928-L11]|nr:DegV family protein [Ruminococcaceae bacterium OttesenSCG-928-L11]